MNVDFYTAAVDCAYLCVRVLEKPKEHTGQQQNSVLELLWNFKGTNEHLDHLVLILNTQKMKWKSEKSVAAKNKSNHVNALHRRGLRAQS